MPDNLIPVDIMGSLNLLLSHLTGNGFPYTKMHRNAQLIFQT